jgi:hypothetical protein
VTVYYLFKSFMSQQYRIEDLRYRQLLSKDNHGLKLQAYERLAMFVQRIQIDNLFYRLVNPDLGPNELRSLMLVAIQQEFEHNATQQLYVSNDLFKIISLAKDQIQHVISVAEGKTNLELLQNMHKILHESGSNPLGFAAQAIKDEASIILQ